MDGGLRLGRRRAAFGEADRVVSISELHFHRFNSTPLECDGALVEYNRGIGQWTIHTNNQFPGFAAIMMAPAMRWGWTSSASSPRTSAAASATRSPRIRSSSPAACSRASSTGRCNWTEWRTDFHLSMSHGNERWFHDTEVAVGADGTLLGFRTKALDDAGA